MKLAGKRRHQPPAEPEATAPAVRTGPIPEPLKSADHPAWVEYAVSKGGDRRDAELATKEDLIVVFGSGKRR